jgi:Na+/H+ antiporter NhaD/arsenite permease-like protein
MMVAQIVATSIFVIMFAAIIYGKVHRVIPAAIGAALIIIVVFLGIQRSPETVIRVLNLGQITLARFWMPGHEPLESTGVNWQTIIFIFGMMTMIEGLARVGFFRWLCLTVAKMVNYQILPIYISFMILSGFLAMFIDSITVMLFLATVIIELSRLLKFDPVPLIIAAIFAANTGGSATMSGDPPNIIIGTAHGYTFADFVVNTGPIAWAGMVVALGYFLFFYRKSIKSRYQDGMAPGKYPEPKEAITSLGPFLLNTAIFLLMIALLVTHAQTGLSVAFIGVIVAVLTLVSAPAHALKLLRGVDWRTLLFFFGLFICVGGLEETGTLETLANAIEDVSGGSPAAIMAIIIWVSAFLSAVVDNIPFAATMVPVISRLSQMQGLNLRTLSWTLALGTDIGGNATPIGASANVVGTAIAEREGHRIGWGRFIKAALPGMILVVGLSQILLMVRYL